MTDYHEKTKYVGILVGVFLLLLLVGEHYFPAIKNYLGFLWWSTFSLVSLFPIYYHKKTQLPCMMKIKELDAIKNDVEKVKRRIILERSVSIFSFLIVMMVAIMYLIYA